MNRKLTHIPNPNKISNMEHAFLEEKNEFIKTIKPSSQTEEGFKGHMISMPNSFASTLTKYLIETLKIKKNVVFDPHSREIFVYMWCKFDTTSTIHTNLIQKIETHIIRKLNFPMGIF